VPTSAPEPLLKISGLSAGYGKIGVLNGIDLTVGAGEIVALLGPNGAGKSTLLQVAGLLPKPAEGRLRLDGVEVARPSLELRRRLAVALQEPLLVQGSVLDNVALPLKLRGVRGRERRERASAWLERFGIAHLAGRPANRISGGEAQRASLARAFAVEPELLLLDEPFSGLDEAARQLLLADLQQVIAETGVTAVFVTHDRDEALRLADRVAVVIGGWLRQCGPVAEVFGAPADEEVAAFVGVETIVSAEVVAAIDGLVTVDVTGARLTAVHDGPLAGEVRLCIRPEDVVLQLARNEGISTSARNLLLGRVTSLQQRGAQVRVALDCGFPLVALVTRLSAEELGLAPGAQVAASVKASAVHLLPVRH
jgi:tungstate transport system ATP-binding protein